MTPWGKNFKRRSLIKLKMSATVIYRFLNWIAPCKVLLVSTVLLESFPVTLKTTTQGKFESMKKLRDFSIYHIIIYPAVPYNRDFVPFNLFFLIFTLKTFASSYRKMYLEMRRMKNCYSRGINGVSLVRHFLKQARWPVLLFIFFGTAIGREHWKKNFKNCQITFFFLRNHLDMSNLNRGQRWF